MTEDMIWKGGGYTKVGHYTGGGIYRVSEHAYDRCNIYVTYTGEYTVEVCIQC